MRLRPAHVYESILFNVRDVLPGHKRCLCCMQQKVLQACNPPRSYTQNCCEGSKAAMYMLKHKCATPATVWCSVCKHRYTHNSCPSINIAEALKHVNALPTPVHGLSNSIMWLLMQTHKTHCNTTHKHMSACCWNAVLAVAVCQGLGTLQAYKKCKPYQGKHASNAGQAAC